MFKAKKASIKKCLNNFLDEEQKSRLKELNRFTLKIFHLLLQTKRIINQLTKWKKINAKNSH